jgi:hypothetical protein
MHDSIPFAANIASPCDRHPSAKAMTAWYRGLDRLILVLCAHCTNAHDVELLVHDRLQGAL